MTAVETWEDCLSRLARHLGAQRAALRAGRPEDLAPFLPPLDLEGLPPRLRERAGQLLQECADLLHELETASARVARQLQLVTVLERSGGRAGPAYVDDRA